MDRLINLARRLAGRHVHAREFVAVTRGSMRGMVRTYYNCAPCDVIWYEEKAV